MAQEGKKKGTKEAGVWKRRGGGTRGVKLKSLQKKNPATALRRKDGQQKIGLERHIKKEWIRQVHADNCVCVQRVSLYEDRDMRLRVHLA